MARWQSVTNSGLLSPTPTTSTSSSLSLASLRVAGRSALVWCQFHTHGLPACLSSSRTPANRDPARRWLSRPLKCAPILLLRPYARYPRPASSSLTLNAISKKRSLVHSYFALPSLVPGSVLSTFLRFQSFGFAGYNTLLQRSNAATSTPSVGASRDTIAPSIWIHVSGHSPAAHPSRSVPYLLIRS